MALRNYWVAYTGALQSEEGEFDPRDDVVPAFLKALTAELALSEHGDMAAVLCDGRGRVVISAVFQAPSDGNALDFARVVFSEAIDRAGGESNLPDGTDAAWRAHELLQELLKNARGSVKELVPA
jgi:hypothetical protein